VIRLHCDKCEKEIEKLDVEYDAKICVKKMDRKMGLYGDKVIDLDICLCSECGGDLLKVFGSFADTEVATHET